MEIFVTDFTRSFRNIIDNYVSFNWTVSYNEETTFEIILPIIFFDKIKTENIIEGSFDVFQGIVQQIEDTNEDDGTFVVKGFMLNTVLKRRIFLGEMEKNNVDFSNIIDTMFNSIKSDTYRKLDIDINYTPENIKTKKVSYNGTNSTFYDIIQSICKENDLGFKVFLNKNNKLELTIYEGKDNSNNIVFSDDRDTIFTQEYINNTVDFKNFVYIEGKDDYSTSLDISNQAKGINRIETFLSYTSTETTSDYATTLKNKAKKELNEKYNNVLSLNITPNTEIYKYNIDYALGDKIKIESKKFNLLFLQRITSVNLIYSKEGEYVELELGTQERLMKKNG